MSKQNQASEPMTYVARKPCGCCTMATLDEPSRRKETAKAVAAAILDGNVVERVTSEWVRRESEWGCMVCSPERFVQQERLV